MNRICRIEVRDRLVNPNEPEIWISVFPERQTASTEVRGRIMGPRCLYSTTVEVAYPLRPFAHLPDGMPGLSRRVIIPEASFWDPDSPFLYQGPVELWEEDRLCDQATLTHGLRTLTLGSRGLRLNSKPFNIRGVSRTVLTEAEALELRRLGNNTVVTDVTPDALSLWDHGDRVGFMVLGRLAARVDCLEQALSLRRHPSCLGWIIPTEVFTDATCKPELEKLLQKSAGLPIGVEVKEGGALPAGVRADFIICPKALLGTLPGLTPKLLALTDSTRNGHDDDDATGVLGTIEP